jgi:hypothetical protein
MRIALALLLVSTAAHADTEISLGTDVRALRTSSANALTDDSLWGGHVMIARELRPNLWVTGAANIGGATGTMFEMSTSVLQESFSAGVRGRYPIAGPVAAIAHADLGVSNTDIKLEDPSYQTLSDHAWAPLATGALGIEVGSHFRFELGYVACASVELTAKTHPPDDGTIRLPMTQASLGSLDLSGKYASASWLVRF